MDSQLKRGLIDACVLAAISRGESYGYQIITQLPQSLEMSESTLYPVLRRICASGQATQRNAEHHGRLRHYYAITEQGMQRVRRFLDEQDQVMDIYQYVRDETDANDGVTQDKERQ